VLTVSYGAPLVTVVAMKPIAAEFGAARSAPALAVSLTYIGSGLGGILMGWISGRVGVRRVVIGCSTMLAVGLAVASFGGLWSLYLCNLLFVGLLGSAGMFSPIMTYLTRWFDDHRGSAAALVSSGQYVAGALWPPALQFAVGTLGWHRAMLLYAALVVGTIVPMAALFFRVPPGASSPGVASGGAIFCCCVTMAMPLSDMVAFCDIGIGPANAAPVLSTQLAIGTPAC
jgi:MFS family permease